MQHTSTPLFNELIQEMTPMCLVHEKLDLIRKVKNLQEYTEKLEQLIGEVMHDMKDTIETLKA